MEKIPQQMLSNLIVENVFYDDVSGRTYAMMRNGCEGNLVVID